MCSTPLECAPRLFGTRPTSVGGGVCVKERDGEREKKSLDYNEEEDIRKD